MLNKLWPQKHITILANWLLGWQGAVRLGAARWDLELLTWMLRRVSARYVALSPSEVFGLIIDDFCCGCFWLSRYAKHCTPRTYLPGMSLFLGQVNNEVKQTPWLCPAHPPACNLESSEVSFSAARCAGVRERERVFHGTNPFAVWSELLSPALL